MNRLAQKNYKPLYDRLPHGQSTIEEYDAEATAKSYADCWQQLGPGVVSTGLAFLTCAATTADGWVRFYEGEAAAAKNEEHLAAMRHKAKLWRDNATIAIELHDLIAVRLAA